ncbi:hypothetical protein [Desulfocurvibacter africanus]|uniref:hypothetical protein n=1 Tax=Desulfocurvibacter africanus TaxID=873 RepID=UPI0004256EEA|nr:hypothetical protein [Desulfocurvibacter africanus]
MTLMPRITLRNAMQEDFDEVYPLLRCFTGSNLPRENWRAIFSPPFHSPVDHVGFLLRDNDKAVGFMGCIFSRRSIRGREFDFCNLSSWIVLPDYRKYSMLFMRRLAELDSCVLTSLTPSEKVYKLFMRSGYKQVDQHYYAIPPLPFGSLHEPSVRVTSEHNELAERLTGDALRNWNDHRNLDCRHFLLESEGESCHIVCAKRYKRAPGLRLKNIPVAVMHHASNPDLVGRAIHSITRKLCLRMRAALVLADSRFIGLPSVPLSLTKPAPRLYRPCKDQPFEFAPHEVDNLYSEYMLLHF